MAHLNWLVRVAVPVVVPRRSSISRVGKTYEIRRRSADLFDVGIDTTFVSVVPSEASRKAAQHGGFATLGYLPVQAVSDLEFRVIVSAGKRGLQCCCRV